LRDVHCASKEAKFIYTDNGLSTMDPVTASSSGSRTIAPSASSCPEEVSYRVYVMRGSCGHDVGVVGPGSLAWDAGSVALDRSGYRPITMESKRSARGRHMIPEVTTTTRTFKVIGGRYKQTAVKRSTGRCHHCASWHCTKR
jgi:hypothetical protein